MNAPENQYLSILQKESILLGVPLGEREAQGTIQNVPYQ